MYTEEIQNLLEKKFLEEGFQDCFLISIEQHKQNIQVFIDSDTGINFEKCQKISRYLESFIDTNSWFGDHYVLEVSSPGISRPLVYPRQYLKNKGRDLDIILTDGSEISGNIMDVNENGIIISRQEIRKEGKKKIQEIIETQLEYKTIKEAKIVIKI